MKQYIQLTLKERAQIEQGLDRGDSFREIARLIDRHPSTVSREVKENRYLRAFKARKSACRDRNWCKRTCICSECTREGAYCVGCNVYDCRDVCPAYALQTACDVLTRAPWVCNGCRKNRYGCNRPNRYVYKASMAQNAADERRSESRTGIDMPKEKAEAALSLIKEGMGRGLSPYEISVLYEDAIGIHRSTIYRWVEAGYGGLTNLELERKVGFKQRKASPKHKATSHSKKRSYEAFLSLPEEVKAARSEMDCVEGRASDVQATLTFYNVPSHVQLILLLKEKTGDEVKAVLKDMEKAMPKRMHARWCDTVLTDNGIEFEDEQALGKLLGEEAKGGRMKVHLYYCDPRQSQQKGSCEKNHTEVRQILEKGMFAFDDLDHKDIAVLMSHVNSNPRESLGGKSPIQMLRFIYGDKDAQALLDAFGIEEKSRDEIMLKPEILDIERAKRGKPPVERAKKKK